MNRQMIKNTMLVIEALLGVYGINYLYSLVSGTALSNSVFSVMVFAMILASLFYAEKSLEKITDKKDKKRRICYSIGLAFLFSLMMVFGYQLRAYGMTECGVRGKGLILIRSLCIAFAVFPFSNFFFVILEKVKNKSFEDVEQKKFWKGKHIFFVSWILIFVSWIPVFLAYYPAVMGFDFHRQSQEAMKGFIWFNSHHPLIHTWLIWLFLHVGEAVGSYEVGMACYSIFQMLVLASALAYSCAMIYRIAKKKWPLVVSIIFYGFFPYNSILAVGVTKDVLFSALLLVFVLLLMERTFFCQGRKKLIIDILLVLEGILMILFRNNALYAVLLFGIIFVICAEKKEKVRVLVMCLLLVIGGKLAFEGMQLVIGTEGRGSDSEKYSVLIQQFARVGYYHGEDMPKEDKELLNKYVSEEYWKKYYPPLADSVKIFVAIDNYSENWKGQMPEVLGSWIKLGLKYPNEYIDAFLCLTSGYWFLDDVSYAEVFGYGIDGRMGALPTFNSTESDVLDGIEHISKMPKLEAALEEITSANSYYNWPVLSNFFKTSFYCWVLLLIFIGLLYIKEKKKCLMTILPLTYLLTMFLGPVVQVRYVFAIIILVPMFLVMLVYQKE